MRKRWLGLICSMHRVSKRFNVLGQHDNVLNTKPQHQDSPLIILLGARKQQVTPPRRCSISKTSTVFTGWQSLVHLGADSRLVSPYRSSYLGSLARVCRAHLTSDSRISDLIFSLLTVVLRFLFRKVHLRRYQEPRLHGEFRVLKLCQMFSDFSHLCVVFWHSTVPFFSVRRTLCTTEMLRLKLPTAAVAR